jgi:hypothetical protein
VDNIFDAGIPENARYNFGTNTQNTYLSGIRGRYIHVGASVRF